LKFGMPRFLASFVPVLGVAVAVEDHALVLLDGLLQHLADGGFELRGAGILADRLLEFGREGIEASVTIVLSTVAGQAAAAEEPTARNSNLLPVKAKGWCGCDRPCGAGSGGACGRRGRAAALHRALGGAGLDLVDDVGEHVAQEDRHDRGRGLVGAQAMVVGRRATEARSRSACVSTARITAQRNTRNCMFVCVSSRGSSRLTPVLVASTSSGACPSR
jgi:hypothetical protein